MNILWVNYESEMTELLQYCYKRLFVLVMLLLFAIGKRKFAAERAAFAWFAHDM